MIRITYQYVCDVCGGEIRPSVIYEHQPLNLVPQPAEVGNFGRSALCAACFDVASEALESRKGTKKGTN